METLWIQPVADVQVDVEIIEIAPITVLRVPKFALKLSNRSNRELLYYEGKLYCSSEAIIALITVSKV